MVTDAPNERRWVAVFDSVHYVLAAERVFKERGVWYDLIPTPREISSDCGMAVEFRESDLAAAREVLTDPRVKPSVSYRPVVGGYEAVSI
jgi:hypothetical protein